MKNDLSFTYERMKLFGGFDGRECKISPQITKTEHGILITYSMLLLSGSDVVTDTFVAKSEDGGKHFGTPKMLPRIENRTEKARIIFGSVEEHYSRYHKKWFAFGGTHTYENEKAPVRVGGISVCEPMPWRWDDGSILENYNTMQRWIRHKDGLFLAYTRKGAHNDHVFRHRAPLFMARFDKERLCLVRDNIYWL